MTSDREDESLNPSQTNPSTKPITRSQWERVMLLEEQSRTLSDLVRAGMQAYAQEAEVARIEARHARRRYLLRYVLPHVFGGVALIAALVAINSLWFAALGS